MLVFIDDSGDPGFKLNRGSTSHFIIAAVAIKELKRRIGFNDNEEFRFFKTKNRYRVEFLKTVARFNFRIRCLIVDKSKIYSDELKNNKNSFYAYFIKEALKNSDDTILNAKIRLDGGGSRIFRKSFITYLRRELNSRDRKIMRNFKMVNSKKDVLIQIADMIAGSINRSQNKDKKDAKKYRNIIRKKIQDEWFFQ
jgi:hypothetical protein